MAASKTGQIQRVPLWLTPGNLSSPSLAFIGDINTGLKWKSAGSVALVSDGVEVASWSSTGFDFNTSILKIGDGTAAAPSLTFDADTDTGLFRSASNRIDFTFGGAERMAANATNLWLGSGMSFGWTSNASSGAGTIDIYASRLAAGQLGLNLDSTHGVVLDVNTDGRMQVLSRAGGAAEVRASTVSPTTVLSFVNAWEALGPATGQMRLTNWAGTTAIRLDFATDGQLHVKSGGDADTATVRASKFLLPNAAYLYGLNSASAERKLIGIDGSNVIQIGADGQEVNVGSGGLKLPGGTLLGTTTALTNGAAAQTATLTNGPTAGNPTKWIPINDNGTTRYIPAW